MAVVVEDKVHLEAGNGIVPDLTEVILAELVLVAQAKRVDSPVANESLQVGERAEQCM